MLRQITPVILTFNEAPNIERTLRKLEWADDILVVDSFSDDETLLIAQQFSQVRVLQRQFDNFAGQCNYALAKGGVKTEWVLNLDADYNLTDELIAELTELNADPGIAGYRARFVYCINGRRLRSGIYPPVTVLFRKSKARFIADGHAHRVVVDGQVADLHSPVLHDDRKSLGRWFQSQVSYTALEARKLATTSRVELSWTDRVRRWRVIAPVLMPFYCLIVRGGILDGWAGLYYAFQRTVAELMLSLYLFESDPEFQPEREPQSEHDEVQSTKYLEQS
jgi:glycosyltransferase involved in cell wall biosynthesis